MASERTRRLNGTLKMQEFLAAEHTSEILWADEIRLVKQIPTLVEVQKELCDELHKVSSIPLCEWRVSQTSNVGIPVCDPMPPSEVKSCPNTARIHNNNKSKLSDEFLSIESYSPQPPPNRTQKGSLKSMIHTRIQQAGDTPDSWKLFQRICDRHHAHRWEAAKSKAHSKADITLRNTKLIANSSKYHLSLKRNQWKKLHENKAKSAQLRYKFMTCPPTAATWLMLCFLYKSHNKITNILHFSLKETYSARRRRITGVFLVGMAVVRFKRMWAATQINKLLTNKWVLFKRRSIIYRRSIQIVQKNCVRFLRMLRAVRELWMKQVRKCESHQLLKLKIKFSDTISNSILDCRLSNSTVFKLVSSALRNHMRSLSSKRRRFTQRLAPIGLIKPLVYSQLIAMLKSGRLAYKIKNKDNRQHLIPINSQILKKKLF